MKAFKVFFSIIITGSCLQCRAWDGYDYGSSSYVEIEKGNLVREGKEIEFYDYSSGGYRTGTVESISKSGSSVEVEITDDKSGETRTFDMD